MGEGKQGFVNSLQKNRSASEKYLISSSIASPNRNNMSVPKFWLTAQVEMGDNAARSCHRADFPPLPQRDANFLFRSGKVCLFFSVDNTEKKKKYLF